MATTQHAYGHSEHGDLCGLGVTTRDLATVRGAVPIDGEASLEIGAETILIRHRLVGRAGKRVHHARTAALGTIRAATANFDVIRRMKINASRIHANSPGAVRGPSSTNTLEAVPASATAKPMIRNEVWADRWWLGEWSTVEGCLVGVAAGLLSSEVRKSVTQGARYTYQRVLRSVHADFAVLASSAFTLPHVR